jgi:PPOX class probable F420-dependent enzyme
MASIPTDDPVVAKLLDGPNLARVAYIGLDGRPKVVPIWFTYDAERERIVMVTGPKADKVPALLKHPAIAMTIDTSTPPYAALLISGDATVEDTDGMASEYPGIVQRYLGAGAEAYLAPMRGRVKTQRRISVAVRSWRVLDFVKRFPKSLR